MLVLILQQEVILAQIMALKIVKHIIHFLLLLQNLDYLIPPILLEGAISIHLAGKEGKVTTSLLTSNNTGVLSVGEDDLNGRIPFLEVPGWLKRRIILTIQIVNLI